jgi:hypothetical protein
VSPAARPVSTEAELELGPGEGTCRPCREFLGTRVRGSVVQLVASPVDHAGGRAGHFGPGAAGGRVQVGGCLGLAVGQLLADVGELVGAERDGRDTPATARLVSWPGGWVVPACFPYAWKGCEMG